MIFYNSKGNDLFRLILGPSMAYSTAHFSPATTKDTKDVLTTAQSSKHSRIASALSLTKGMRVLDIGCGWGSLAHHLSKEHPGVHVTATTNSVEGAKYCSSLCKGLNVNAIVTCNLKDLQSSEKYDAIVLVEVLEHVGVHNLKDFFQDVHSLLKDGGKLFLQSTIYNDPRMARSNNFYNKIQPGSSGMLLSELVKGLEGKFLMREWNNISGDSSKTYGEWIRNLEANRGEFVKAKGEGWTRMWELNFYSNKAAIDEEIITFYDALFTKI